MRTEASSAPLLVVQSYHHRNTEKVAEVLAAALAAKIRPPREVDPAEVEACRLIGLGSGIYFAKHHRALLEFAERLPRGAGKPAFIFSTSGVFTRRKLAKDHAALRHALVGNGYSILGEFGCRGWDTYSILKYVGGLNKGRPNAKDLERAEAFAQRLQQEMGR